MAPKVEKIFVTIHLTDTWRKLVMCHCSQRGVCVMVGKQADNPVLIELAFLSFSIMN